MALFWLTMSDACAQGRTIFAQHTDIKYQSRLQCISANYLFIFDTRFYHFNNDCITSSCDHHTPDHAVFILIPASSYLKDYHLWQLTFQHIRKLFMGHRVSLNLFTDTFPQCYVRKEYALIETTTVWQTIYVDVQRIKIHRNFIAEDLYWRVGQPSASECPAQRVINADKSPNRYSYHRVYNMIHTVKSRNFFLVVFGQSIEARC